MYVCQCFVGELISKLFFSRVDYLLLRVRILNSVAQIHTSNKCRNY